VKERRQAPFGVVSRRPAGHEAKMGAGTGLAPLDPPMNCDLIKSFLGQ
jgi:hypothetical protein